MASFPLRHLIRLYREFDGDLIMPIILGEIGHYNVTRFFSSDGYPRNPEDIPTDLASDPLLRLVTTATGTTGFGYIITQITLQKPSKNLS